LLADELIKVAEKENVKNLKKYILMLNGSNKDCIKKLILETAKEFKIEQLF